MENTYAENEHIEEYEFKYNFINTPWDDRTVKSKVGIIALLLGIFLATWAIVAYNFVLRYKHYGENMRLSLEISCQMVRLDEYGYAARIHSVGTKELLCIGALVSATVVLANGACAKSGPIRLHLGNPNEPRCKKGFSIDVIERIQHEGAISKKLVLLMSYENFGPCSSEVISLGNEQLKNNSRAYVIGRTMHGERSLSRQPVVVTGRECVCSGLAEFGLNRTDSFFCVKNMARCPILAGDLLVQGDRLYGLASTSVRHREEGKQACFADVLLIKNQLRDFDITVRSSDLMKL